MPLSWSQFLRANIFCSYLLKFILVNLCSISCWFTAINQEVIMYRLIMFVNTGCTVKLKEITKIQLLEIIYFMFLKGVQITLRSCVVFQHICVEIRF